MHTKKEIRKAVAERKKTYIPDELRRKSEVLLSALEQYPLFQRAETVLLYYSLPDEVFTHEFVARWSKEKEIILPVVTGDTLELCRYEGPESLKKGSYGIDEPTGIRLKDYSHIQLAIIPGVGFDMEGNRLGRGKGYYDRLLPQLNAYKIGICFQFQIIPQLPTDTFDIRMDEVWTEEGCISRK
ncbi:5-formyltetrahydrofolate cyclo-ligase [uncultured Bacteroides sp.]|uniref:5-formyltetrahydrofolate cyclo-ligase n=1 Tax=uncultured Bacteroides sp. TaxID=162156 RepID=UPI00262975C7|nr:5-formyltetrahydrofolate cyclo-ligase [uncultured Bacteroides sp.]